MDVEVDEGFRHRSEDETDTLAEVDFSFQLLTTPTSVQLQDHLAESSPTYSILESGR